jgi:CheY-like chemotaxis protein
MITREPIVLCVDDDPAVLSCLRRLLAREPYRVEIDGDPEHALERVAMGDVSLVLVDQRMPGMCGSDFAERVRQLSPATLRVMLTAYPGNVFVHHGLSDGVQWLMSKPWNDEALRITLMQLLRDQQAGRSSKHREDA